MTIHRENWERLFRALSEWYSSSCEEWIEPAAKGVEFGQVDAQIKLLGIRSRISKCNPNRKPKLTEPALYYIDGATPRLVLILPPVEGRPEWRLVDSEGKVDGYASLSDLWDNRGDEGFWHNKYIATLPPLPPPEEGEAPDRLNPTSGRTRSWFWGAIWECRREFLQVIPASIMINLFALTMPMFIMNVYDRVVPNSAFDSLWVLASGVMIVFGFEFVLRIVRGSFVDLAGKGADAVLARRVFRQTLDMELASRPPSAGNFAGQTRGYETVREFLSSLTLIGLLDFPFGIMMFSLVFILGGVIGWVPVIASAAVLLFLIILQPFLSKYAQASHEDRVHRQSLMTESANGLESIKAVGAGPALEKRMADIVDESAEIDLKTKRLTQMGGAFTALCVHMTTVGVIVLGTYQISENNMSMGALIACVMIVGRGMAPLNQVSQLLLRLQGTRAALKGLDTVMSRERESSKQTLKKSIRHPDIRFAHVHFQYADQPVLALSDVSLRVHPGEKIGVIGRAGSGKTTLLRILNRQLKPGSGLVLLDGVDLTQLDPDLVRQNLGYLPQDGFLFFGTLKENIALGGAGYSDDEILAAAEKGGVMVWANKHPQGLDMEVGERGVLLSGGQRQNVLLARTMISKPDVLLLDEPTASMDLAAENAFHKMADEYLKEDSKRTLVLATHKMALLRLVDRIILLDSGKVIMDGPRDQILDALKSKVVELSSDKKQGEENQDANELGEETEVEEALLKE